MDLATKTHKKLKKNFVPYALFCGWSCFYMFRIILAFAITVPLVGCAVSQQRQASSSSVINEATLKRHISFLADDKLEGRGTGARGGELAAKYIAAQLQALGVLATDPDRTFFY